jgi:hypothetical protein
MPEPLSRSLSLLQHVASACVALTPEDRDESDTGYRAYTHLRVH